MAARKGANGLTQKQENFCRAYVETGNASEAYRRSYDAKQMKAPTINQRAYDLLQDSKISARIAELQSKAAARHEVTIESITTELEEARGLAKTEKQPSAMVAASLGKAKLHGLVIDKAQVTETVYVMMMPEGADESPEGWAARHDHLET